MRKLAILSAILLSALSCTGVVDSDFERPAPRLILNAMLDTADDLHLIFLSIRDDNGGPSEFVSVFNAEVLCFVNGVKVAQAEERPVPDSWYSNNAYELTARFNPGDEVRIQASKDGQMVYAEVVVPEPVGLELADTVSKKPDASAYIYDRMMDVGFVIKDNAGTDDWLRVGECYHSYRQTLHFDPGIDDAPEGKVETFLTPFYADIGADPILNDGHLPHQEGNEDFDDIIGLVSPSNKYGIFPDSRFKDSQARVSVSVPVPSKLNYYAGFESVRPSSADVSPSLLIGIQTLSKETYSYLKALNAGDLLGFEVNPLSEPVIIPCNVAGGLGFVGISTTSFLEIRLPDYFTEFDGRCYIY